MANANTWADLLIQASLVDDETEALNVYYNHVGDIVTVPNDYKRGGGPAWLAAIVTDNHVKRGGSLEGPDPSVFVITSFYPHTGPAARGDDKLSYKDLGKKWRLR